MTVKVTSGETVNAFWYLLNNQDMLNNLPNLFPDKPHLEMYIKPDVSFILG